MWGYMPHRENHRSILLILWVRLSMLVSMTFNCCSSFLVIAQHSEP
ncbi:hypothetical protein M514_17963 [Trichuris suis]|uniref:Uncharacterized protein n=1 Tax=Trichuris suis TaxID=68888 RepID=A0A085NK45_9BILA|nr:hypothetical protein M514_17963 [Trichuris suis]